MVRSSSKTLEFGNPEFPTEYMDRFIFALHGRMDKLYVAEKPMTTEKAIEFLGISKRSFSYLVARGQIKQHRFAGLETPFYFPSEMYETLKKS
jgi:hypothetical protein